MWKEPTPIIMTVQELMVRKGSEAISLTEMHRLGHILTIRDNIGKDLFKRIMIEPPLFTLNGR